jgi:hypothetical protein
MNTSRPTAPRGFPAVRVKERTIQAEILRYLANVPGVMAWRANVGAALDSHGNFVRYGVKGQADISGIIRGADHAHPIGTRLEIEVKTTQGTQSEAQINYGTMIVRYGGVYIVARSVEDVARALAPFMGGAT